MTNYNIVSDMIIAINADGFTRLQMKHMLLALVDTMTLDQIEKLLSIIGMNADDLRL